MSIDSRLKSINFRFNTADTDILVTSRNGDRKKMQSIRIANGPLSRIRKWNKLSQFRQMSIKVVPTAKRLKLATFRR